MTKGRPTAPRRTRPAVQMRSFLVGPLLRHVERVGADPHDVVRRFGALPVAGDGSVTLGLDTLREVFDVASVTVGESFVGLELARAWERGTFGLVEFSAMTAPNVGAGLRALARYNALLNDVVTITLIDHRDHSILDQRIPGVPWCLGRHLNEFFVVGMVDIVRRLTGRPFRPRYAYCAHRAPRDTAPLERALGTSDLRFDAGSNGIAIDAEDMLTPMQTADPPLARVLEAQAERLLAESRPVHRFEDQVRAEIHRRLALGLTNLDDLAEGMHMSPRTFQRRLADEGATLRGIVDGAREALAREWVLDPSRSAASIAADLGYADARAFLRAFERWTGTTPRRFRVR